MIMTIQVNFSPSRNINFALKFEPKTYNIDNHERFFGQAKIQIPTLQEHEEQEKPMFGAPVLNEWIIPSHSDPNKTYKVVLSPDGHYSCSCPHHVFRKAICKHIIDVQRQRNTNNDRN